MVTLVSAPTAQYGFAFGDGTTNQFAFGGTGQGVQVLSVEGLEGFPNLRVQDTSRGYMDGAFTGRDFVDARTVTFHLQIMSDVNNSFQTYLQQLQQYLMIQRSGTSVLQVYLPGGRGVRRLYGRVRKRQITIDPNYVYGRAEAMLEFYCPDPRIYNDTLTTGSATSGASKGRTYPKTYPFTYSATISGGGASATVTNAGNYETWPIFTLNGGACSGPVITNNTTGDILAFPTLAMTANDFLVINSDLRTVMFGNSLSNLLPARNYMSAASSWFPIKPNNVPQTISISTATGTQTLQVSFRDAYI